MKTTFRLNIDPKDLEIKYDFYINFQDITYQCSLTQMALFSRQIWLLSLCDPCLREFNIPIPDPDQNFNSVIRYIYLGNSIIINQQNINFFIKLAPFLQNDHLDFQISNYTLGLLNDSNAIPAIEFYSDILLFSAQIQYIVEHFQKLIKSPNLKKLPLNILDVILSNIHYDDNQLFNWITDLISNLPKNLSAQYASLYAHINFSHLSQSSLKVFFDRVSTDQINGALWASISSSLCSPIKTYQAQNQPLHSGPLNNRSEIKEPEFDPSKQLEIKVNTDDPFNGVFNYIDRNGGISKNVECKCKGGDPNYLKNLLTEATEKNRNSWWSNYSPECGGFKKENNWIQFHFLNYSLSLKSYCLSVISEKFNNWQARNWKIYGSSDGQNWDLIDERINVEKMNRKKVCIIFNLKKPSPFYSYFRYEQIKNWSNSPSTQFEISLHHVEFFGVLNEL